MRIWVCGLTVYEMYEGSIPFRAAREVREIAAGKALVWLIGEFNSRPGLPNGCLVMED